MRNILIILNLFGFWGYNITFKVMSCLLLFTTGFRPEMGFSKGTLIQFLDLVVPEFLILGFPYP